MTIRRAARWFAALVLAAVIFLPTLALAGPRSGGSFSGRPGFRAAPSYSDSRDNRNTYGSGSGSHFIVVPGWGWGGGYGYGHGGVGLLGTLFVLLMVGVGAAMVMRAVRRSRQGGQGGSIASLFGNSGGNDDSLVLQGRAFLYKLQLALGRSARSIQDRLAVFAAQGDTSTEAGLAAMLQQSALELLRNKDSIRYALADGRGPMTLTNAETAMNAAAMAERARFQVERVRVADGRFARSDAPAEEGKEALELIVVTLVVATRTPLEKFRAVSTADELAAVLAELGGVPGNGLLGLEVIWTPADANDSMTETDVMTTYPELRSL
ncbi:MAG TPA: DUF1517 domain-containing protein [Polyangia bacterium]|jgi:uncharacterized membrane protein|nr:DUF1517 domain-containing protein [Polyangia bacterium]